ncbi:hypothetical protein D3C87_2093010 [compost metagenome]
MVQRQAQDVLIELARFFSVTRLVGVVVQLLDGRGRGQGGQIRFQDGVHAESPQIGFAILLFVIDLR